MKKLYILLLAVILTLGFMADTSSDVSAAQIGSQSLSWYSPYPLGCVSSGIIADMTVPQSFDLGDSTIDVTISNANVASYYNYQQVTINGIVYNITVDSSIRTATITIPIDQAFITDSNFKVTFSNLKFINCSTSTETYITPNANVTILSADDTPPLIDGATGVKLINVASPETVSVLKNSLTATDETDGDVTASIVVSRDLYTSNNDTLGDYEVDFTANDSSGNYSTITVTYRVIDVIDPIISLIGGTVYVEYGSTFSDPGYSALDNYDGSTSVVVTGTVNNGVLGTYTLHYNATDTSGNTAAEKTRTVYVRDTTVPVQTLNGASTIYVEFGQNYSELGATWSDVYDGSGSSVVSGTVNVGVLGTYTVLYNKTDSNGNVAAQITRTVIVRDTTSPTFSGDMIYNFNSGSSQTISLILEDIHASDIYDGDLSSSIIITSDNYSGHENEPGTYTLILGVEDSLSNTASYTLTITIVDNQAPIFSTSENIFTHEYADSLTQQDLKDYFGV